MHQDMDGSLQGEAHNLDIRVAAVQGHASDEQEQQAPEAKGTTTDVIAFNLRTLATFRQDGPGVVVLSDVGAARVVLFAFQAGQQLREHQTSSQILVQVLRGQITFSASDTTIEARAGTLLQVEADVRHSVAAQTNAVVLLTMVPSPSFHGREHDVSRQHTPLVARMPNAPTT